MVFYKIEKLTMEEYLNHFKDESDKQVEERLMRFVDESKYNVNDKIVLGFYDPKKVKEVNLPSFKGDV